MDGDIMDGEADSWQKVLLYFSKTENLHKQQNNKQNKFTEITS